MNCPGNSFRWKVPKSGRWYRENWHHDFISKTLKSISELLEPRNESLRNITIRVLFWPFSWFFIIIFVRGFLNLEISTWCVNLMIFFFLSCWIRKDHREHLYHQSLSSIYLNHNPIPSAVEVYWCYLGFDLEKFFPRTSILSSQVTSTWNFRYWMVKKVTPKLILLD